MRSSIEISHIKNLNTEKDVLHLRGSFIEVSEFTEKTLTLEMNGPQLWVNQLVSLKGQIRIEDEIMDFVAVCKVVNCSPIVENFNKLEFRLQQFNQALWARFLIHRLESQRKADELFKSIKGDG